MAVTYRSVAHSTDSAAATSLACNVPTGTVNGDLMFMLIKRGTNGDPSGGLTGWTLGQSNTPAGATSHWVYYRVASSEPASYTPDWGASSSRTGVTIITFTGNHASPIDAWSDTAYTTSDTTLRAAAFTVGAANYHLVLFGCQHSSASVTVTTGATVPITFTERVNDWTSASRFSRYIASGDWSGSGSTGTIDATLSATSIDKHMFAVSIIPAAGGGGTAVPVFVHQLKQQGIA
jgi:hypothetical protein